MSDLRVCFAGTPQFAADHLSCLLQDKQQIVCVYTQPDRPAGRGKHLYASPVKNIALEHGLDVRQPSSLKGEAAQEEFRQLRPDLLIVVAYGLILPKTILEVPKIGCINVHASLLPRWRGAAPIERSLLAGDKETGVTIMLMDEGLDTGPMLHKQLVAIEKSDNRETLTDKLSFAGQKALLYTLHNLPDLIENKQQQDDSLSTYATKIAKEESELDWTQKAEVVNRVVRASLGRIPAYSFINGERVRILAAQVLDAQVHVAPGTILGVERVGIDVACDKSILRIKLLQLPGKNPWSAGDLLNSRSSLLAKGKQFDKPGPQ